MRYLAISILFFMCSCNTISVTIIHTQGHADDVVDQEQSPSNSTTANPNISIPASVIP